MRLLKARRDLVDPPLNEMGLKQSDSGSAYINEIDFEYVFVTPMVRTCMTAMYLY